MIHDELIAALIDYRQCDEEGIYCITSRQAVEECAAALREQQERITSLENVVVLALNTEGDHSPTCTCKLCNLVRERDEAESAVSRYENTINERDAENVALRARLEAVENDLNLQVKDCIAAIAEAQRRGARLEAAERDAADKKLDAGCYHLLCGLIRANPNAAADEVLDWFKGDAAQGEPT